MVKMRRRTILQRQHLWFFQWVHLFKRRSLFVQNETHIHTPIRKHTYSLTHTHSAHIHTHVYMHAHMHTHMHTHTYIRTFTHSLSTYIYMYTYRLTYVNTIMNAKILIHPFSVSKNIASLICFYISILCEHIDGCTCTWKFTGFGAPNAGWVCRTGHRVAEAERAWTSFPLDFQKVEGIWWAHTIGALVDGLDGHDSRRTEESQRICHSKSARVDQGP